MPTTLSAQLSSQLLKYLRKHDVSQKAVAKYLELSPSFLSEVLAGKKNFSPLSAMRLSQMLEKKSMNTEKADASVKQFSFRGKPLSSHIEHFESSNNGSWVSGSGSDPNDDAIVVVPTGVKRATPPLHDSAACKANLEDTLDVLGAVKVIHSQAIDAINDYVSRATGNRG